VSPELFYVASDPPPRESVESSLKPFHASALTPRRHAPVLVAMRHKSSANMISLPVRNLPKRILAELAIGILALIAAGCGSDEIEATNKLVQQQQEQLERQQGEIEALKESQNQGYTPRTASSASGACDKGVEGVATKRGGEHFAAGDFAKALGYYQDALAACPTDDRAEVNVARTYEALGNNASAIRYYRKAADSSSATVSDAQEEATAALERLQASRLP
jgi:tetratricopeptide (TPR) repeat protein